jgi:hypothetical protein
MDSVIIVTEIFCSKATDGRYIEIFCMAFG